MLMKLRPVDVVNERLLSRDLVDFICQTSQNIKLLVNCGLIICAFDNLQTAKFLKPLQLAGLKYISSL